MKNFALLGVAGYIAPRHLEAIKATGNNLIAAYDKFDSVGIMDSYFPNADFFTEFERFDRHLEKLKYKGQDIDYFSICTPNYLHDAHIRSALRRGADAICEKPLVLNPWNLDALKHIEKETGRKVYNILQLRLHKDIIELKKKVEANPGKKYDIDLSYITSRGNWYHYSWKGDISKSGGVATNIGIHFFDMLSWIFGGVKSNILHYSGKDAMSGYLELENANVRWFLSINYDHLSEQIKAEGKRTYRSITVDGEEIEFSGGFTDLHIKSYEEVLKGNGFGLEEARPSIEVVHELRGAQVQSPRDMGHPFLNRLK
ncbi:Gfo/Idh/MocA family oxidoreductase [Fulvivirga sp. 29W222]|uniref:Gfo/Idh/MocA family oxidoreductase n=1 Tax=Fulvivirga marina TaxID=2494733 RepID=A0A937KDD0_9BACT|nr:Gfo/Idh/MocA family oxidoreductase [Fulvivirga marina]MBL6448339.1 Gfo/Idh/MocA family oxidoreductase [Fulvivirga marina]